MYQPPELPVSMTPARLDAMAQHHDDRAADALRTAATCDPGSYTETMWKAIAAGEEGAAARCREYSNHLRHGERIKAGIATGVWAVLEPDETDAPVTLLATEVDAHLYIASRSGRTIGPLDCAILGSADVEAIIRINAGL